MFLRCCSSITLGLWTGITFLMLDTSFWCCRKQIESCPSSLSLKKCGKNAVKCCLFSTGTSWQYDISSATYNTLARQGVAWSSSIPEGFPPHPLPHGYRESVTNTKISCPGEVEPSAHRLGSECCRHCSGTWFKVLCSLHESGFQTISKVCPIWVASDDCFANSSNWITVANYLEFSPVPSSGKHSLNLPCKSASHSLLISVCIPSASLALSTSSGWVHAQRSAECNLRLL